MAKRKLARRSPKAVAKTKTDIVKGRTDKEVWLEKSLAVIRKRILAELAWVPGSHADVAILLPKNPCVPGYCRPPLLTITFNDNPTTSRPKP